MILLNLFSCFVLVEQIDAAKILAYIPFPSVSHQLPFRPLFKELAKRGHELTVITTDPAFGKGETPANYTEIDVHDVSYGTAMAEFKKMSKGKKDDFINQISFVNEIFTTIVDNQFNSTEVRNAIFGKKYDILLSEAIARSTLAVTHIHKIPVIMMSSLGGFGFILKAVGAPTHPLLYPTPLRQRIYNLTVWEKITELYNHYRLNKIFSDAEESDHRMLQKHFGRNLPPFSELYNRIDMVFLNIHPIFEGNQPVPPNVIYIWGIHKKPEKELPQDLKKFLDSSKHGVIYMSFGTNTDPSALPSETIEKFVKVFCQLPYDVLWKWNKDEPPGKCPNIKTGQWFPQSDLLKHPNIKVFVTQGGLQSTDEAIRAGVPLVGIPMLGDQWYNVEKYVHFRIGVQLDIETFTEEKFKDALTSVINEESYRRNIRRLDALMRDEPTRPLQRAVWWVEHVLRHGGARHLRAPAANISWAQYFEIELVLIVVTSIFVSVLLAAASIYYLQSSLKRYFLRNAKLKCS